MKLEIDVDFRRLFLFEYNDSTGVISPSCDLEFWSSWL